MWFHVRDRGIPSRFRFRVRFRWISGIELFVFRIVREIAAMAASLQGLDVLVFTGGIGEHSPQIRELICSRLKWLNVDLSTSANDANATVLSTQDSTVEILLFPAN
jgi:acetate kinase